MEKIVDILHGKEANLDLQNKVCTNLSIHPSTLLIYVPSKHLLFRKAALPYT